MTPGLAPGHQRVEAPRHVDVAEHLEVPGLAPARLVDLRDVAAGDRAGVVDQDVGVGAVGREPVDVAAVAEVERVGAHRDIVLAGDLGARRFEIGCGARHQDDITAFLGQHLGAGPADPLRRAGDERLFAAQPEFHVLSLVLSTAVD